jgi:hypothetical protein
MSRSPWPHGLNRRSAAAWLLGNAGSNPAEGMDVCLLFCCAV